jgi:hypothetical protein
MIQSIQGVRFMITAPAADRTAAPYNAAGRASPGELLALSQACKSLWLATLSLMTAYMQCHQPAHRYLLARRISRNFSTLYAQPECFNATQLASFARLSARWQDRADRLAPEDNRPRGGMGWLQKLLPR